MKKGKIKSEPINVIAFCGDGGGADMGLNGISATLTHKEYNCLILLYDNESYAMRMFISDSLRPPGLERLNVPGPLFGIREDQSNSERVFHGMSDSKARLAAVQKAVPTQRSAARAAAPQPAAAALKAAGFDRKMVPPSKSGMTNAKSNFSASLAISTGEPAIARAGAKPATATAAPSKSTMAARPARWVDPIGLLDDTTPPPGADAGDEAWSMGNPNRLPEQAMAEYWGEGKVPTGRTYQGEEDQTGTAYGSLYSWGNTWQQNGGTRFMRKPAIPFWQRLSREGADYDIEETLGTAARETDGLVRRWDMSRLRSPGGEEYRRYGQRTGYNS